MLAQTGLPDDLIPQWTSTILADFERNGIPDSVFQ